MPEQVPDIDLYALLQVSPTADTSVIVAAHRALIRRRHPDISDEGSSLADTKLLNLARDWLTDPARRATYDETRQVGKPDLEQPESESGTSREARTAAAPSATRSRQDAPKDDATARAMWAKWWKAAESSGHVVRNHPDPKWDGYPLPEPSDPVLRSFALAAEGLGEGDVKLLIHGLSDSGWRREEFREVVAELPERVCEEAIWAYRLPNAFIQSRIPSLEPHYVTLFQEALKHVAFAIAARETAPDFSSAILNVWRRHLGAVPGVDTTVSTPRGRTKVNPGRSDGHGSRRLRQEAAAVVLVLAMFVLVLVALAAIGGAFDGLIPSTSGWPAFRAWASEPDSNAKSLERRARFAQIIRSPDPNRSEMSRILADERQYIGLQLEWLRSHRPDDCYRDAYDAIRDAFRKEHEMLRLTESSVRWSDDDEWARARSMAAEAERMREQATSIYLAAGKACERG